MSNISIGLAEGDRKSVSDALQVVLADTYTLYLQSQNFHWNVKGQRFYQLHNMFEEHYTELAAAIDEIAERVQSLGFTAVGTFKKFLELATIKEVESVPSADEMVDILKNNHEKVIKTCRETLKLAQDVGDEGTADLMVGRIQFHEKTSWMLRSMC